MSPHTRTVRRCSKNATRQAVSCASSVRTPQTACGDFSPSFPSPALPAPAYSSARGLLPVPFKGYILLRAFCSPQGENSRYSRPFRKLPPAACRKTRARAVQRVATILYRLYSSCLSPTSPSPNPSKRHARPTFSPSAETQNHSLSPKHSKFPALPLCPAPLGHISSTSKANRPVA
jgi:hypothetical protein